MRQSFWPDSEEAEVTVLMRLPESELVVFVAERAGGGLCAFAEVGTRKYAEGCATSPVAYLEGIWVDPDVRRSGVGLCLVREAAYWAASQGRAELASDCDIDNEASRAFHVAAGFEEAGRIICFRRGLEPLES